MWRNYSKSFIKNNRSSGVSIMVAAFVASLFLSFLCTMFYNVWVDEVKNIVLNEGDWEARITGDLSDTDLLTIRNFANVEKFIINKELSEEKNIVVDVYFHNPRSIFKDMPLLIKQLHLEEDAASYHLQLLSRYLIHDPQDEDPPLLLTFYLGILLCVSISLILVIRNSFAVSMNERIRQFGIFSGIGASPAQIRTCLMQEAAALCTLPVLLGSLLGVAAVFGTVGAMNVLAEEIAGIAGHNEAVFQYHPLIFAVTILFSVLTVIVSAWMPAWRLSRQTPLESIRNPGGKQLKWKKHSRILELLFGIEGELAGNALRAQKKALRTFMISLTFSFMGFTMMLCVFSLTDLSTNYTYFERYQDVWDVMVTLHDTKLEDVRFTEEILELQGVEDSVVYQKAEAMTSLSGEEISGALTALGGPEGAAGSAVIKDGSSWLVKAPLVILEDGAFKRYAKQIGVESSQDGTIILNRFWDSLNSNFRNRAYIPFIKEDKESIVLQNAGGGDSTAEIPVLGFTGEVPVLKEEYADYSLVQFIPLSLWKQISGQIGGYESDTFIRVLGKEDSTLEEMNLLEGTLAELLGQSYELESENRLAEKISNDKIISGYKQMVGIFCFLLAAIGIANVFSYTLGFMRQRKREFARYMSVGMTPEGMRNMFCIEALVIAGRPILITLPLTSLFVIFITNASYLNLAQVLKGIPFIQMLVFCLVIIGSVASAYYIGGKKVLGYGLTEALRDDTMG